MGSAAGRTGSVLTQDVKDAREAPPRAGLTFRVGIVGHRPNRLPHDQARLDLLRHTIRTILTEVQNAVREAAARAPEATLYAPGPPQLRAISPLAEGSDRIFAEEAIALGYEFCCPLPFAREEFEKDFAPGAALEEDSLARFRGLLERAGQDGGLTLFEMDGERADAPEAYGAAGRIVLNQTDLLLAVWDGGAPGGAGGTVATLKEALRFHVPVIRIDAMAPDRWQLVQSEADLVPDGGTAAPAPHLIKVLAHIVENELRLPGEHENAGGSHADEYFRERKPRYTLAFVWKLFRDLVVDLRLTMPRTRVARFEAQIRADWPTRSDAANAPSPVAGWVNGRLRAHFAWADGLANFYADSQRSAFILSYLLSASAVLFALAPRGRGRLEIVCTVGELIILVGILGLLRWSRKQRWQERWTEYRLLAELIRQLRFLVPLGGGKPLPRMPAHMAVYGDPARTWMYWHMRAIARQTGIPSARVTPEYMRDCLDFLAHLVGDDSSGQMEFHRQTERRARILAARLRDWAVFLFCVTIAGVAFRLALLVFHIDFGSVADHFLILASAVLPAFGAALEGISNQGEFVRVAKRSAAMASGFEKYAGKIAALKTGAPRLREVIPLSSEIATAMVDEIVDWRAVFVDRTQ